MDEIRVGMRLLYDGEPCVVRALRRISTGEPVESASREEFGDIVAVLGGQGWEAKVRLTDDALERISEAVEEALAGVGAASDAVEDDVFGIFARIFDLDQLRRRENAHLNDYVVHFL